MDIFIPKDITKEQENNYTYNRGNREGLLTLVKREIDSTVMTYANEMYKMQHQEDDRNNNMFQSHADRGLGKIVGPSFGKHKVSDYAKRYGNLYNWFVRIELLKPQNSFRERPYMFFAKEGVIERRGKIRPTGLSFIRVDWVGKNSAGCQLGIVLYWVAVDLQAYGKGIRYRPLVVLYHERGIGWRTEDFGKEIEEEKAFLINRSESKNTKLELL